MNIIMKYKFILLLLLSQFLVGQDYILLAPQVTGGQVNSESENYRLSSNTSSLSADFSSSDSFSVSQGIMGVTKGLYALPPVVSAFIADTIYSCLLYTSPSPRD